MMHTNRLQGNRQTGTTLERCRIPMLGKVALTLLCVGATSAVLTAFTTLNAFAAQPSGAPVPNNTRPAPLPPLTNGPHQDNNLVMAGSGKLNIGVKLGTVNTPAELATVASISFAGGPSALAGAATVLTVNGAGSCKYHLSYVNLDANGKTILKPYPMMPKSSSKQNPFPMTMPLIPSTPSGIYQWTATGVEGCTGTTGAILTVQ